MNKKAQQFRNKNHLGAQTQSNTQNLQQIGNLIIPLSAKVFEMEKSIQNLQRKLVEAKATALLAEYKATALQKLSNVPDESVRALIADMQREDFTAQSNADDANRGLIAVEGPAVEGQIAIVSGKVLKDGVELLNEEIIGSKITLGEQDLYQGIDDQIIGMKAGETKTLTFKVNDQEYSFNCNLLGLREFPAREEESNEETKVNE